MEEAQSKKYLFEEMPVHRALLTMAVPTIISQIINLIYNMVDTIFIGMTGDAYKTAAVTLAFTVFMMTVALSNLFGIGGGSLIARLIGRGEHQKARGISAFAFYGAIGIALLYSLLIGAFEVPILNVLGASENTLEYAKQYLLLVVVIGNLPVILSAVAAHLLRNTGFSKQAGFGLSLGGVLNMLLDPLCMFVLLPEGMEVFGAALATLLSNVASCVYLVLTMARVSARAPLSMNPQDIRLIGREDLRSFFSVGIPSALLTGLFDIGNVFLNALIAAHGDLELAAIGIVMKIERVPNAINVGICQGMLPIVAYNYSSGNHVRMKRVLTAARRSGLLISAVALVLFELLSPVLCGCFLNTGAAGGAAAAETVAIAAAFLRVRCIASPFQFLNYSTSYSMQAVGYGAGTMLHAIFRELVFYIPFMFLLDNLFGVYGLVSALACGEGAGALFALLVFRRWQKRNLRMGKA